MSSENQDIGRNVSNFLLRNKQPSSENAGFFVGVEERQLSSKKYFDHYSKISCKFPLVVPVKCLCNSKFILHNSFFPVL